MAIVDATEKKYSIEEINAPQGLYIEEIAQLQLYYTEWMLVTHINMTEFEQELSDLKEVLSTIQESQGSLPALIDTKQLFMNTLITESTDFLHNIEKWFPASSNNKSDKGKQATDGDLNANSPFDSFNDNTAKEYLRELKALREDTEVGRVITEKQITLFLSNFRVVDGNSTFHKIMQLHQRFLMASHKMDTIIPYINLLLIQYQNLQTFMLESIASHLMSGTSNEAILPPAIYKNLLWQIRNSLSGMNLDLPLPITTENLPALYKLTKTESKFIDNNLVIVFKIPLVSNERYKLYKATSLPYRIAENLFGFIVPQMEYMALDLFRQKYVALNKNILAACNHLSSTNVMCKQTLPIVNANKIKSCEIDLLRRKDVAVDECNWRIMNLTSELWLQLKQANSFVYVFPEMKQMFIYCNGNRYHLFLENTGIVKIDAGCQLGTEYFQFRGVAESTNAIYNLGNMSVPLQSLDNILEDVNAIREAADDSFIPSNEAPMIIAANENLENVSYGLRQLKRLKENMRLLQFNELMNTIFTCLIIFCIFLICFGLTFMYCNQWGDNKGWHRIKLFRHKRENKNEMNEFTETTA